MGMAASSLRFAQLTARKNQVEFEGQQINQQRLTLSQKSSAIYNDMLTKQVPTAPDPSAFTKIVYKFNAGFGESSILNLAKKSSGAYNYNVTYKKPKTTRTLSRSSYSNVGFSSNIGSTNNTYALTANIDGVARNLTLVGGSTAQGKLETYRKNLQTYQNMKTIEEQITDLRSKPLSDPVGSTNLQNIKNALSLDYKDKQTDNAFETALKNISQSYVHPTAVALSSTYPTLSDTPTDEEYQKQAAYNMAVALGLEKKTDSDLSETLTQSNMTGALNAILADTDATTEGIQSTMSTTLRKKLTGANDGTSVNDDYSFGTGTGSTVSQDDIKEKFKTLNDLEQAELANLLAQYANSGNINITEAQQVTDGDYNDYNAVVSLEKLANGQAADGSVTNAQMIKMLEALLPAIGEGCSTSGDYKSQHVEPAYTQYQASCATAGVMNISQGQALFTYDDDIGEKAYMYVSLDNILDDGSSSYADSVSVYENVLNYLDGETETDQMDANVVLNDDGQVSKITFSDGTVVTPEVVTEMDQDAYDQAMVEYEYKKEVYDKEMNDANAKVKIIQAQDQKLEVRLKQLDTEQKALQTEIDAVKSVRDKAIESSFKTFS